MAIGIRTPVLAVTATAPPAVEEGRLAIVSEFAPDDRWTAGRAMARNRTIAGFSSALVIADCVASGGTTDQLDVPHRAAGLKVYVRRASCPHRTSSVR